MARVYHRDQAGEPALVYGSTAAAGFNAVKAILKACLVSGYGSLPAAGWELIAEGSNHLVLRSGNGSGYVGLTLSGFAIRIYLSKTFTGMSGSVMTGAGLKTGVAASNSTPQAMYALNTYFTTSSTWAVVADEKTFVLNVAGDGAASPTNYSSIKSDFGSLLYVGEDTVGNFIAVGGNNTTNTANTTDLAYGRFSSRGFTALTNPATGLLVDSGSLVVKASPLGDDSVVAAYAAATVVPKVDISRIYWTGDDAYAGQLRGIVVPASLAFVFSGSLVTALGASWTYDARQVATPIALAGATWLIPRFRNNTSPNLLMTDHEDYW